MNGWPLLAGAVYHGLRIATWTRVTLIDEGGLETLKGTQPILIAANHQSHADTAVLFHSLPRARRRRTRFVASASRFRRAMRTDPMLLRAERWFLHGLAVHAYNSILVGGESIERGVIASLSTAVSEGSTLVMYPEGTRSTTGALGVLRPGVAMVALAAGCSVVPVRIDGTRTALPKSARFPRLFTKITLRVRAPINPFPSEAPELILGRIGCALAPCESVGAPREAGPHLGIPQQ